VQKVIVRSENAGSFGLTLYCSVSAIFRLEPKSNSKGVWFECFLFLFLLEIENSDKNTFDWKFENSFSENIFSNKPKTENNEIWFSVFWIETKNLILGRMKRLWQILNKSKNTSSFETHF